MSANFLSTFVDNPTFNDRYTASLAGHRHLSHGPLNPGKALKLRGLRFAPTYEEMANEVSPAALSMDMHEKSRVLFGFLSVGLQICVGILTGLAAWPLSACILHLTNLRLTLVINSIQNGGRLFAWLIHFGIMVAFALSAALPVIFFVPSAGSSGIPPVIGLLNGVDLRDDFTWRPLLARFIGVMFSVSSGLAVGPEGPMIFVGACIGALLSKIPSNPATWRRLGRVRNSLNDHVYLRDYISTGAACGIAAAFRAPIAGVLFVVEEAASHFRREHLAKMFMACVAAKLVVILINSSALFEYQVTTGDFCNASQWLSVGSIGFYMLIGAVCGLAGAAFNWLNLFIVKFRTEFINPRPILRSIEILVLCAITSLMWVILPLCVAAEQNSGDPSNFQHGTRCIKDEWRYQLVDSLHLDKGKLKSADADYRIRYAPKGCLYGVQLNEENCGMAYQQAAKGNSYAQACTTNLFKHSSKTDQCCYFDNVTALLNGNFMLPSNTSCPEIDFGSKFPSLLDQATDRTGRYNPMASLTLVPFSDAAVNLFSRGTPFLFHAQILFIFLIVYFFLAAATSGSAVPAGLLLPMIIIGGVIGRLMAILFIYMQWYFGWYSAASFDSSIWTKEWQSFFYYANPNGPLGENAPLATTGWLDPGVSAMVGAAAMLGGVSRISLMLTVMMVEITGDPSLIGPMAAATLFAVVVGNFFNHGLYHSLIDIASYPFLPDKWPKAMPKALRIYHILPKDGSNVYAQTPLDAQVPLDVDASQLRRRLERCHGNTAFAVTSSSGAVVGLALRQNLSELLHQHETATASEERVNGDEAELAKRVDVAKATDFHCITVRESLPLEVAYNFFKSMEMEHVLVVDDDNRPIFILTRSSLLPWRVEETVMENGFGSLRRCRAEIQRPRSLRSNAIGPNTFDEEANATFIRSFRSAGSLREYDEDNNPIRR